MAAFDRSIFRQRAIDRYMQRRELHVILRLVSPRVFVFLWILLLLAVAAGMLVWTIQEPVIVQGRGIVVQSKAASRKNAHAIVVLLLFPPDQRAQLKVGQPVNIAIAATTISFHSTIQTIEAGVMSPAAIGSLIDPQRPPAQTIEGPAAVALAPVEPMSQVQTYLGSQCQAEVQVGSQSALALLPGYSGFSRFLGDLPAFFTNVWRDTKHFFVKIGER
jgi:hypothetical protein